MDLRLGHRPQMQRSPTAGGFLILVAILVGSTIGVAVGNPVGGAFLGTVAGVAMAIAVWLIDRRR